MIKKFLTKKSKIRIYIIYFEDALLYNYLLKNVNTKYYNKRLEGVYMKLNENINNIQNQDILQGLSKEEVDKRIKEGNYKALLNGSASQWIIKHNSETKTIAIGASTAVEDNPLYYHDVLTFGDKKIGYLVYNHFTPGPTGVDDRTYDEEMKTIFADFQSKGVNEFVLDLRYNGGGYEHSANMLAGLLISEEYKDKVFGIFSNNKGKVTHTRYFNTETGGTTGYLKLNSNRIYILTSENTASSSELVISSLEPFMNIILIGELTEGKNVGMQKYSDDQYEWAYWPITTKVTNAVHSDYSAGFTPDYDWNEFNLAQNPEDTLLPLGSSDEFMLNKAITLITGTNRNTRNITMSSQTIQRSQPIYQSIVAILLVECYFVRLRWNKNTLRIEKEVNHLAIHLFFYSQYLIQCLLSFCRWKT